MMKTVDVTNLADDGRPGSLRHAVLSQGQHEHIRIQVPGIVRLRSDLKLGERYDVQLTGCMEPPGTTIARHQFVLGRSASLLIEQLRVRWAETRTIAEIRRNMIDTKHGGARSVVHLSCQDVVWDHCYIGDSTDDNFGILADDCARITLQNSIVAGGYGRNRMGVSVLTGSGYPPDVERLFVMKHSLLVLDDYRMWKIQGGRGLIKGNVIVGNIFGSELIRFSGDIVGNYFVPAKACATPKPLVMSSTGATNLPLIPSGIFVYDNYLNGVKPADQWTGLMCYWGTTLAVSKTLQSTESFFGAESLDGEDGMRARDRVLAEAGPSVRDEGDKWAVDFAQDRCAGVWGWL